MDELFFARYLISLRNELVQFWGKLVQKHGHTAMMDKYTSYAEYLDLLDPDCPCHAQTLADAAKLFRMGIIDIMPMDVSERKPISLEEERLLEAFHGC